LRVAVGNYEVNVVADSERERIRSELIAGKARCTLKIPDDTIERRGSSTGNAVQGDDRLQLAIGQVWLPGSPAGPGNSLGNVGGEEGGIRAVHCVMEDVDGVGEL
jgi:hypothetical protein